MLKTKTSSKRRKTCTRSHFAVRTIRNANPASHRLTKSVRALARIFSF